MRCFLAFVVMIVWPIAGSAQHYNTYGMPGLIDMPIASSAPDAELAFSVSSFAGQTRGTATFQLSDRISASLGYAQLNDLRDVDGHIHDQVFDRSFGLHYRLRDETAHWPALAIGVNDFVGTGVNAGEYVVATKTIGTHFSATLGLGWGRLASNGGSSRSRPQVQIGEGGAIAINALFRGDTALFGGLRYRLRDDLTLLAEYSSDAYSAENGGAFQHRSPVNIGLTYMPASNLQFAAQYLYGSEFGLRATFTYDPSTAPAQFATPSHDLGKFAWQLKPYIVPNLFDPDSPLRADFGLGFSAQWELAPGVVVTGNLRQRIAGNLDQTTRESDSVLPHVRSDFAKYGREGDLDIDHLAVTWHPQLHHNVRSRLTVGLLEEMFAGASAELLWQAPDVPFALGFELNALQQRDYRGGFRLRDYQVLSGHGSFYWNAGGGYHIQVDAGRYLAGDWGGTLTLSRRFENGWSLGAFATLTDVPFDQFGEGSFDKGIMFSIPLGAHGTLAQTIRPVTRDGGARVHIDERLYDARANVQR